MEKLADKVREATSERLRTRFTGATADVAALPTTKEPSPRRRRRGSTDSVSQVSLSSNAPNFGSGSHVGSPRVAKTGWNRRSKVSFPSTTELRSSDPKTSRTTLKSAMKAPQRPPTPPLPEDRTTGPSLVSLSDSQTSEEPHHRRRRLSFKEPSSQAKRPGMPGAWSDSFLPKVTNADALVPRRRRPSVTGPRAQHPLGPGSFVSDSEYTDSELSDDTHATTVMSDATIDSPKVQMKTRVAPPPAAPVRPPPPAPSTVTNSSNRPAGRTLTIEVHPPKESEEAIRKREDEARRRERFEADLTTKIANIERHLQADSDDHARQLPPHRDFASMSEPYSVSSAPATPQTLAPVRQPPMPPQTNLSSPRSVEGWPPSLNAQARPFRPSPRPRSMTAATPIEIFRQAQNAPDFNHMALHQPAEAGPPMPLPMPMPMPMPMQMPMPMPMPMPMQMPMPLPMPHQTPMPLSPPAPVNMEVVPVEQSSPAVMHKQIESQAKQLADLQAMLTERNTRLAAAELERDETRSRLEKLCKSLEDEVHTVRSARSHSEEVLIAKLAACELVRDVLNIKIEGFESEVKTKTMMIDALTSDRDQLSLKLQESVAEVSVLTERTAMLEAVRERATKDIISLQEELGRAQARISGLEEDKSALGEKLASLEKDADEAKAKMAELENSSAEKDAKITSLESDNSNLREQVNQVTASGEAKDKQLEESNSKLAEAEQSLASSQDKIAALETDLAALTESKAKQVTELQEKLAAAETSQVAAREENEKELAAMQDKVTAAEAEAAKANADLKELQDKIPDDYTAAIAAFGQEKDELSSKVTTLQAEVESRTAEANDMVSTFAAEKAALEAEKSALEAQKTEIELARAAAAAESARLTLHVAQLKAKIEASKNKKTVPTTAAASAAAAVKSNKTSKIKQDFFFVRTSQDRGRMQVVKKSELRSSRSSSRTGAADE